MSAHTQKPRDPDNPTEGKPIDWTEGDANRLRSLNIQVCRYVKPKETLRLYGITQRLSARRMRLDGTTHGHPHQLDIEKIPDLSAAQCAFLYDAIRRVLDGERDAFKAFGLALPTQNPSHPHTPFMAAEYELARRYLPKRLHKQVRMDIAQRYHVTPARLSKAYARYRETIDTWIENAESLAAPEQIPRELMLRHLHSLVGGQAEHFIGVGKGSTLSDTAAEHLFNVEFPILLVTHPPGR